MNNDFYQFNIFDYYIDEAFNYYNSLSEHELINQLNDGLDNLNSNLNYYAKLLKEIFDGRDYDEHYHNMKSLSEELNDIKIILNILKERKWRIENPTLTLIDWPLKLC